MFIYLIVNHITGKYYVGQHKGNSLKKYLQTKLSQAKYELKRKGHGRGSYLFASMRKHDPSAWSIHALRADIQNRQELDETERDFISFLRSQDPEYGYNICRGGEGFTGPHSPEACAKVSKAVKGMWSDPGMKQNRAAAILEGKRNSPSWFTPEGIESLRKFHTGRRQTEETCQKIRDIRTGTHHREESKEKQRQNMLRMGNEISARNERMWSDPKMRQTITTNRKKAGYACSLETRAKLSEAAKRFWSDPEKRQAASERAARIPYRHSPEVIEKIRLARRSRIKRETQPSLAA